MMRNSDRRAYAWSIVLFTVSFGYYIFSAFLRFFRTAGSADFCPMILGEFLTIYSVILC